MLLQSANRLRAVAGHLQLHRVAGQHLLATVSDRGGAIITGADGQDIHLPAAEEAVTANYKKWIYCSVTETLRTSTHVGTDATNTVVKGKVGNGDGQVDPALAKLAARGSGLRLLATIHRALDGDLSRVLQVSSPSARRSF